MGLPLGAYRAGAIVSGERRRSDRGRRRALDDAAGMGGENEPRTYPCGASLTRSLGVRVDSSTFCRRFRFIRWTDGVFDRIWGLQLVGHALRAWEPAVKHSAAATDDVS